MADIIHKEGFPEGWFIHERSAQEALLCRPCWQFGSQCVCLKPRAIAVEDWLPTARKIAVALNTKERKR